MKVKKTSTLEPDGERMVPEHNKGTLMYAEHMTRYQSAMSFVSGKTVLDIASGSGYGTHMLSKTAKRIYGVDISKDAIEYSKEKFSKSNIEFMLGDGQKIPLDDNSVEVVTTFETIEHIDDYNAFLDEICRVLKDDGLVLVSTPNDLEYPEGNHFHLHEFEYEELHSLLCKRFKYVVPYFQVTYKSVVVASEDFFTNEAKVSMQVENMSPQTKENYVYFYFLCSNKKIRTTVEPLLALGELYSEKQRIEQYEWNSVQQKQIEDYQMHIKKVDDYVKILENRTDSIKNLFIYRLKRLMSNLKSRLKPKA